MSKTSAESIQKETSPIYVAFVTVVQTDACLSAQELKDLEPVWLGFDYTEAGAKKIVELMFNSACDISPDWHGIDDDGYNEADVDVQKIAPSSPEDGYVPIYGFIQSVEPGWMEDDWKVKTHMAQFVVYCVWSVSYFDKDKESVIGCPPV